MLYDAVILAGGAARRLNGIDKPGLVVGAVPLIERVAAAVSDASRLVVVGPRRPGLPRAWFTSEDPPVSGPVAALRAGMSKVSAEQVALLAADLPFLTAEAVAELRLAAQRANGAVMIDSDGREQWLIGVWRTSTLLPALTDYVGGSLGGLLSTLNPVRLRPAEPATWLDCDTMEDVRRAREQA